MQTIKNLSIRAKLWLLVASLLVLTLATSITLMLELNSANQRMASIYNNRVMPMQQLKLIADAYGIKLVETTNKVYNQQILAESGKDTLTQARNDAQAAWNAYMQTQLTAEEKALADRVNTLLEAISPRIDDVLRLFERDDHEGLGSFIEYRLFPSVSPLAASLQQLSAMQEQLALQAYEEAQAASTRTMMLAAVTVAILLVLTLISASLIIRTITRNLDSAVQVAETVAQGDLRSHIEVTSKDELGRLMLALKGMNNNLLSIVGRIRESSESIATGATQISTGNNDLSQRTEEQASNLQQTAASMEELASTVRHNTDNAQQATTLARNAARTASQGGEAMEQVTQTMETISASSRKIADIIGVIDGIAFQTNILALNAAVEAARAGEQGRGFAVVAGEVRALAGRSAEAAKEIKLLIQQSVSQVNEGTTLVEATGKTIGDVVQQVQSVAALIQEISNASQEQSQGTGQVSDAIAQLDQVTQQNAALVEESAAAANSLSYQAAELNRLVATFKTGSEGQLQAPRLAPAAAAQAAPRSHALASSQQEPMLIE
ncbi:methyl-accepting chemotaxis protein [Comamonas kerstersii]|uniref:methyl-accepting chemotaxis protein n=1 Tax=Comamonas kerstersii TaxID=225992 RepID=UPI00266C10E3|nr:methyl-accepting chemotaxis protein [Comamonas kerstersii]